MKRLIILFAILLCTMQSVRPFTHEIPITPVGAINIDGDLPTVPQAPRRAYGQEDDEGFFDDDEGFGGSEDDRYTEEPGQLPIGTLPILFLLLLTTAYVGVDVRGRCSGSMGDEIE